MKIVIASNNIKKRNEMEKILAALAIAVVAADETIFVDVEEDGDTFAANARKKAEAFAVANNLPALADDSGLCVDALKGAPGIYSSRYAGKDSSDAENNIKLLNDMQGIEDRDAHFICALHLAFPNDCEAVTAQGKTHGTILLEADGEQGFGYDPLFFSTDLNRSFASASAKEKASVSHRGRALRAFAQKMSDFA